MVERLKIGEHITTFWLTAGFLAALLSSAPIYLAPAGYPHPLPNSIFALLGLYLLLRSDKKSWGAYGFFIGILWFWWISMSFRYYGFTWAIPAGIVLTGAVYGIIFFTAALISEWTGGRSSVPPIWFKALFLLIAGYIHPFGFECFKPELVFTQSYFGVDKLSFFFILLALVLFASYRKPIFLVISLLSLHPLDIEYRQTPFDPGIELVSTYVSVEEKWDPRMRMSQVEMVLERIDEAVSRKKRIVILPESVLPLFLNRDKDLLGAIKERSKRISIILGALKWDSGIPRNSTYIFTNGKVRIIDKAVLVPFGESNPLPEWMGKIVNHIFYDDAVDYKAGGKTGDYTIDGKSYRNAICYEACSEKLYHGKPERMVVLSNNAWFIPSIEPDFQRLMLEFYSRKYGTSIYHAVNMSESYVIRNTKKD